jgi:hypothetical protein
MSFRAARHRQCRLEAPMVGWTNEGELEMKKLERGHGV